MHCILAVVVSLKIKFAYYAFYRKLSLCEEYKTVDCCMCLISDTNKAPNIGYSILSLLSRCFLGVAWNMYGRPAFFMLFFAI
jgi:hypothetical protein